MAKRQPSSKEMKSYAAAVASHKTLAAATAASDLTYFTCHASLLGCEFDQEVVPHSPALYLIAAHKSTSLKEPLDPALAFSLPVSQKQQPTLKDQMPCSLY